jgi:hypothetical protein
MPRQSFINLYSRVIPAGAAPFTIHATGSILYVRESTAPFDLQLDDGEINTIDAGMQFNMQPDEFRKVTVINRSTTDDLFVSLYAGKAGVGIDYNRERQTRTKWRDGVLASGNWINFQGIDNNQRRKEIIVSNKGTADLLLYDFNTSTFGPKVPASTSFILQTDGNIGIFNLSGSAQAWSTIETFYV